MFKGGTGMKYGTQEFYSPFNLSIDEMKHVLLINIEKNPDVIYKAFEPQVFEGKDKKGVRILAYRHDGYVDLYQEESLQEEQEIEIDVAGKGLGDLLYVKMENKKFNFIEYGIDVHFSFVDKNERRIELKIMESGPKRPKPFSILAPIGVSSEKPNELPVFFLYGFYFVKQKNTEVIIQIEERLHKPDTLPVPIGGNKVYFMRYAKETVIGAWNKCMHETLHPIKIEGNRGVDVNDCVYSFDKVADTYAIKSMETKSSSHTIKVTFTPAIKEITTLAINEQQNGEFVISGEDSVGTIEGSYRMNRQQAKVDLSIVPTQGWKPNETRVMVKLIYTAAKFFKNWPKTYAWNAAITLDGKDGPSIVSKWERTQYKQKKK